MITSSDPPPSLSFHTTRFGGTLLLRLLLPGRHSESGFATQRCRNITSPYPINPTSYRPLSTITPTGSTINRIQV